MRGRIEKRTQPRSEVRARQFRALLLTAATFGVACGSQAVVVNPRSFERPSDIAFSCFDTVDGVMVQLDQCGSDDERFSLTALVTQSSRGEVAALDLSRNRLLDSDVRVPGFTFLRVGEVASSIVVDPNRPHYAYIASLGSGLVQAFPSEQFRPDGVASGRQVHELDPGAAPFDLALSPDGGFLYAALPIAGAVAEIALDEEGRLGSIRSIDLSASMPVPVDLRDTEQVPEVPSPAEYEKLCPADRPVASPPARIAPREPLALGAAARPVRLVVDAARNRLLVADAQLPIVHVLEFSSAGATPGDPIVTSVPTLDLALTPPVPARLDGSGPSREYLYAIDAVDGSILVVDVALGAVVAISLAAETQDRIELGARAQTLAIVESDVSGPACSVEEDTLATRASPLRLRGVFLAAGLADGTVRFIDTYDLDAPCRGGDDCAEPRPNDNDVVISIRRHRPRIGALIRNDVGLRGTASAVLDGVAFAYDSLGETRSAATPSLSPQEACPANMSQIFPDLDEGAPLICALSDPWDARSEQWVATWEGLIPGAQGGRGHFDEDCAFPDGTSGPCLVIPDVPLCSRGVLGSADVSGIEDEPEALYETGDKLVITSLTPETGDCSALGGGGAIQRVSFPIRRAFSGQLELAANGTLITDGEERAIRLEDAMDCFVELMTYEVRSQQAYTVVGSTEGFLHRVVSDEVGRCTIDVEASPLRWGRALEDELYLNSRIAFEVRASTTLPTSSLQVAFTLANPPPELALNPSTRTVLPTALEFSALDQRLYLLDQSSLGLVQIELDPLRVERTFE